MSLLATLKRPYAKWNVWQGRSTRAEYWLFVAGNALIGLTLVAAALAADLQWIDDGANRWSATAAGNATNPFYQPLSAVTLVWLGIILIPSVSLNIRRLHDRGMSGYWYLGYIMLSALPAIGLFIAGAYYFQMAVRGTRGANRYGEDPLQPETDHLFE